MSLNELGFFSIIYEAHIAKGKLLENCSYIAGNEYEVFYCLTINVYIWQCGKKVTFYQSFWCMYVGVPFSFSFDLSIA